MMGYNPNRDSGIAEPRSYVEIEKTDLQGLVNEYDFVPAATQRYFAQLVYNVGPGSGGNSIFTAEQIAGLIQLLEQKDRLIVLSKTTGMETITIDISDFDLNAPVARFSSIDDENTILAAAKDENNEYQLIKDENDFDGNGDKLEYLLNIPGYVCSVECYSWVGEVGGDTTPQPDKILVKSTYLTQKDLMALTETNSELQVEKFPAGRTTIYFNPEDLILIKELPEGQRKIFITYITLPTKPDTTILDSNSPETEIEK